MLSKYLNGLEVIEEKNNIQFDWWQPNERVIGGIKVEGIGKKFQVYLETLNTTKGTYQISEKIPLVSSDNIKNLNEYKSQISNSKLKLAQFVGRNVLDINNPVIILVAGIDNFILWLINLYENCNQILRLMKHIEC